VASSLGTWENSASFVVTFPSMLQQSIKHLFCSACLQPFVSPTTVSLALSLHHVCMPTRHCLWPLLWRLQAYFVHGMWCYATTYLWLTRTVYLHRIRLYIWWFLIMCTTWVDGASYFAVWVTQLCSHPPQSDYWPEVQKSLRVSYQFLSQIARGGYLGPKMGLVLACS